MDADFWHERWQANQIGFHQETFNRHLTSHWDTLGLDDSSRVLVPLCGKSLDLIWLREQGHTVIGIEISPLAVAAFFKENRITPTIHEENNYTRLSHDGIDLLCGNLFALQANDIGPVDAFYDRAALIALPPTVRRRYATQLANLCTTAVSGLLVTLEYNQSEMSGPPFSVPPAEVTRLLTEHFAIKHLIHADALVENARFRDKGLRRLDEHVFSLERL